MVANRATRLVLAAGGLFCLFLYFQRLSPLGLDDITFKNYLAGPESIFALALTQYMEWDGRISGYLLNFSILAMPRQLADIVLSLTPLGLIVAMLMHALGPDWKRRITWRHLAGAGCLLWLSVPEFGQVFFWKTGTPYTIVPMLFLLLLWPYRLLAEAGGVRIGSGAFYAVLPLAVVCGLADFHDTPVIALLTLAASARRTWRGDRRIAFYLPPLTLLACFAVIYLAPGNTLRIETTMREFLDRPRWTYILEHLGKQGTVQFYYAWEYLLLAVSGWPLWRRLKASGSGTTLRHESSLIAAIAFFLLAQAVQLVFMFAPMAEPRVFTSSVIFMIVAALAMADWAARRPESLAAKPFLRRAFWTSACAVAVFNLGMAAIMYRETDVHVRAVDRLLASAKPGDRVWVPPCPYQSGRYLYYGVNFGAQEEDGWGNRQLARHYRVASVRLAPQRLALLPEDGETRFSGQSGQPDEQSGQSFLAFTYVPPPARSGRRAAPDAPPVRAGVNPDAADAGTSVVFAFPPLPRGPAHKRALDLAERCLRGTRFLRLFIQSAYTICRPDVHAGGASGAAVTGSLRLPRLEHTDHGYLAHVDGSGDLRDLTPLRIVRDGG